MQKTSVTPNKDSIPMEEKIDTYIDDIIEDFDDAPVLKTVSMARVSFVIALGNEMNAHTSSQNNIAKVLANLTRILAPESSVLIGKHTVLIEMPKIKGDFTWFREKVERKADLIGTRTPEEAISKAEKIAEVYRNLCPIEELPKFGCDVVEGYIRAYNMMYDKME